MHARPATPRAPSPDSAFRAWRPFGRASDLDLNFRTRDRPLLVTRLLAACGEAEDDGETRAWSMTLSGRIGALAAILALSGERAFLAVQPRCPACGKAFEVELALADIAELGRAAEAIPVVEVPGDRPLRLRRPTGADQRRWRDAALAEGGAAEAAMLADLLEGGASAADSALAARVGAVMEQEDLLAAFSIQFACPHCGAGGDLPLDLEGLLLQALEAISHGLVDQVHRLASRYGWRETDILAMPAHRRQAYLGLLDQEAGWP